MNNDIGFVLFILFFIVMAGIGGLAVGSGCTREAVQKEAIKAGVAEWQINAETGEKKFTWKKETTGEVAL